MKINLLPICFLHEDNQPTLLGASALITIMQFVEGLTDRQAADAVRSRIDWKYALGLEWTGSKIHLSETCDQDAPHLITYVETLPSTTKDHEVTENVHQTLAEVELLPNQHLVDAGYIDAQLLVDSKNNYDLDLIGPAPGDSQWQSRAGKGFGLANFDIDWQFIVVRCPQGKSSGVWSWWTQAYSFGTHPSRFAALAP
jgi:hypothetical protein